MKAEDKILLVSKDPNESYLNFASTPDSSELFLDYSIVRGSRDTWWTNKKGGDQGWGWLVRVLPLIQAFLLDRATTLLEALCWENQDKL